MTHVLRAPACLRKSRVSVRGIVSLSVVFHASACSNGTRQDTITSLSSDSGVDNTADTASLDSPTLDFDSPSERSVTDGDSNLDCDTDPCSDSSDELENHCSPDQEQLVWCGRCGTKRRHCTHGGVWSSWSECLEDVDAECSPGDTSIAPCGNCGTQVVWCDTTSDRCRWVRGVCRHDGVCRAGSFRRETGECGAGMARISWCGSDCTWSDSSQCVVEPRWVPIASAPIDDRVDFSSAGSVIWGGASVDGASVFADGARYDSDSDSWVAWPAASIPANVVARKKAAVAVSGDTVFVFGGESAVGHTLGGGVLRSGGLRWKSLPQDGAPSPRSEPTATPITAPERVFVVFGGRTGFGPPASSGAEYSVDTNRWTDIPTPPIGNRQGHSSVGLGAFQLGTVAEHKSPVLNTDAACCVIIWGGRHADDDSPLSSGAVYDAATKRWSMIADAPIRRANHIAIWEPVSGRMFVLFGEDGNWPGYRGDGAAYDPTTDSWSWLPDVGAVGVVPTIGSAVVSSNGAVWIISGNRAARLDIASLTWASVPTLPSSSVFLRGWAIDVSDRAIGVWGPSVGHALVGYNTR